jgi:hypothetical protein
MSLTGQATSSHSTKNDRRGATSPASKPRETGQPRTRMVQLMSLWIKTTTGMRQTCRNIIPPIFSNECSTGNARITHIGKNLKGFCLPP